MNEKINFDGETKHEQIVIEEFLEIPEVPMQRDTENRAAQKKTIKMLKKLLVVHLEVALIELTKDCLFYGKEYKKGSRFIVNGNTRRYYWANGLSDKIPEKVNATIYLVSDMEEVRKIYNTYDSPDASEKTQEKFYGILSGIYGYQPISTKVQRGKILTALSYACHTLDPQKYSDAKPKEDVLSIIIGEYFEEIKMFDKICALPLQWDSALSCAALMILKKYGNNPKAIEFLKKVEQRNMDTSKAERDGVTHVSYEWTINPKMARFQVRRAVTGGHGGMQETVPFILYWAEKYISGKSQINLGGGWDKMHITWFDDYKSRNNALSKALNISSTPELEDMIA